MRVGIIGTGKFAKSHAKSIRNVGGEVAACFNRTPAKAQAFAEEFGGKAYDDWREMISHDVVDAVYLVLPANAMAGEYEQACLAAEMPFLAEKPMGLDLGAVLDIAEQVRRRGLVTASGFLLRYGPTADAVRQAVAGQTISAIRSCRAQAAQQPNERFLHMDQGAGWIAEWGIHSIDFLRFVFGEIRTVYAATAGGILTSMYPEADIYDSMAVTMQFESGAVGTFVVNGTSPDDTGRLEFVDAYGRDFRLLFEGIWDDSPVRWKTGDAWTERTLESLNSRHDDKTRAFLSAVEKHQPELILDPYEDAAASTAAVLAMNASAESAAPVEIETFIASRGKIGAK